MNGVRAVADAEITVRPGPLTLALNVAQRRFYAFDGKGRLFFARQEGISFRRTPDNRLLALAKVCQPGETTRWERELTPAERRAFMVGLRAEVALARLAVTRGKATMGTGPADSAAAEAWLDRALAWDESALAEDAATFRSLFPQPVMVLPPDRRLDVVVQLTQGCPDGHTCSCPFYQYRGFSIRPPAEFAAHAQAVRMFLGDDPLRRGVFLADANALALSQPTLRSCLEVVRNTFPAAFTGSGAGVSTFVDAGAGFHLLRDRWSELARLGLRRVYVGVILAAGHGQGALVAADAVPDLVAQLHAAGIRVGMVVMGRLPLPDLLHSLPRGVVESLDLIGHAPTERLTGGASDPGDTWRGFAPAGTRVTTLRAPDLIY